MKEINILGIESSCDETAAAVIQNGRHVCSNVVATQIEIHKKFGGVVPEVASRNHVVDINRVVEEAIEKWGRPLSEIDAIAVTYGPGLAGALLVGLSTAKALAYALGKPLIGVNHIEGHIAANYLSFKELEPPFISLVVSGGHTHIVEVETYNRFNILGKTRDDAAGEAYDKVARAIGLGYPGGPQVDSLAKKGSFNIDFPKAFYKDENYDFSFSGLKSAVLNYINSAKMRGEEIVPEDIARSFQETVVEVLTHKAIKAVKDKGYRSLVLSGGVSANSRLREKMQEECDREHIAFYCPPLSLCTDNAAMIAAAAYYQLEEGYTSDLSLSARPNLKIGQR